MDVMEVSVLEAKGAPPNSVLTLCSGSSRLQSSLQVGRSLYVPASAGDSKTQVSVKIFRQLACKQMDAAAATNEDVWKVPVENNGKSSEVKLRIRKPESLAAEAEVGESGVVLPPVQGGDAKSYLGEHQLQALVQSLLLEVLKERPSDPFAFMATRLKARPKTERKTEPAAPVAPAAAPAAAPLVPVPPPGQKKGQDGRQGMNDRRKIMLARASRDEVRAVARMAFGGARQMLSQQSACTSIVARMSLTAASGLLQVTPKKLAKAVIGKCLGQVSEMLKLNSMQLAREAVRFGLGNILRKNIKASPASPSTGV
eukprot:gnl/TRDRNA2_/TRDRNA2_188593_c0_seq1.p1 gnl/TRDRNA2_/TRDRNA2_188593_c0~~gnl/TRDRNA2_/TRDRNA2_188593_c0_seq1.p1  ORF type:complete len:313 (+),score=66.99 gnl/TRDRNA2_/TRDRNA2_188593_c0_seq1:70-1008(+)